MTDIKYKFIKNRIQNIHVGSVGTSFNIALMYGLFRIGPVKCPKPLLIPRTCNRSNMKKAIY